MEIITGIYEIRNTVNNNLYIGSASDIRKRWNSHKSYLNRNLHHSPHLQKAWNKYGKECFSFVVLEITNKNLLSEREQFYMDLLRPVYNVCKKAHSCLGLKPSDSARIKMHVAQLGNKKNLGKKRSQETKDKMSAAMTGKPKSPEHRIKLSLAKTGKKTGVSNRAFLGHKHTDATKEKMSTNSRGHKWTQESKERFSEKCKGRIITQETREKIALSGIGRFFSQASRDKKSVSMKISWEKRKKIKESNAAN